jgi:hypothetical protein
MVHHGLTPAEALVAATSAAAGALGLDEHIGTVTEGKLADLIVVDGDPLAEPALLSDPARVWLVLQGGTPVAGQALTCPVLVRRDPGRRRDPGQPRDAGSAGRVADGHADQVGDPGGAGAQDQLA